MAKKTLCDALRAAGYSLFDREPYGAKQCAQANLIGRTYYADDSTLRCFHARITSANILAQGAAFWIIESVALDHQNTRRGFRYVCFDVDGNVIGRVGLCDAYSSADKARKAFWEWLGKFDLSAHYREALKSKANRLTAQAREMRAAAKSF